MSYFCKIMNNRYYLTLLLYACFVAAPAQEGATSGNEAEFLFFDRLSSATNGEGKIRVFQDARLPSVMWKKSIDNQNSGEQKDFVLVSGFRVQVFSSNIPRTAKAEAFNMELAVKEKFDYVDTYITFTSPFWRVRVGDFRTQTEAESMLGVLRKAFPETKNEFYVVKDNIKLPIK